MTPTPLPTMPPELIRDWVRAGGRMNEMAIPWPFLIAVVALALVGLLVQRNGRSKG